MAYFMVSYDLIAGKDYKRITDRLEALKASRVLLSVWLVELADNITAAALSEDMRRYTDGDDRVVVIEFIKRPAWTRALMPIIAWVQTRFGS